MNTKILVNTQYRWIQHYDRTDSDISLSSVRREVTNMGMGGMGKYDQINN